MNRSRLAPKPEIGDWEPDDINEGSTRTFISTITRLISGESISSYTRLFLFIYLNYFHYTGDLPEEGLIDADRELANRIAERHTKMIYDDGDEPGEGHA